MEVRNKAVMLNAIDFYNSVLDGTSHHEDGITLSVIREAGTERVLSIHITPVDIVDGDPVPRYVMAQDAGR